MCRGDGHTEALRVEYDPSVISYEAIMRRVLKQAHGGSGKVQYQSAVWPQDGAQAEVAKKVAENLGKADVVPILPATKWHDAEDYHRESGHIPSTVLS